MAEDWGVTKGEPTEQLKEELSYCMHDIWIGWMRHQFNFCKQNEDGSYTIPKEKVDRWNRQMNTPYNKLPEAEKDSDREQVDKFIHLLQRN